MAQVAGTLMRARRLGKRISKSDANRLIREEVLAGTLTPFQAAQVEAGNKRLSLLERGQTLDEQYRQEQLNRADDALAAEERANVYRGISDIASLAIEGKKAGVFKDTASLLNRGYTGVKSAIAPSTYKPIYSSEAPIDTAYSTAPVTATPTATPASTTSSGMVGPAEGGRAPGYTPSTANQGAQSSLSSGSRITPMGSIFAASAGASQGQQVRQDEDIQVPRQYSVLPGSVQSEDQKIGKGEAMEARGKGAARGAVAGYVTTGGNPYGAAIGAVAGAIESTELPGYGTRDSKFDNAAFLTGDVVRERELPGGSLQAFFFAPDPTGTVQMKDPFRETVNGITDFFANNVLDDIFGFG